MAFSNNKFLRVAIDEFPNLYLTQRGSAVVLAKSDIDNPFQIWYMDDSWNFVGNEHGPVFVLINHGSKKALKGLDSSPSASSNKVFLSAYDPSAAQVTDLFWTVDCTGALHENTPVTLQPASTKIKRFLTVAFKPRSCCSSSDELSAIVTSCSCVETKWKFTVYVPMCYQITAMWDNHVLAYKPARQDMTYIGACHNPKNDEHNVVLVHPNNTLGNQQELWYKVPAGGLSGSNSSFILISKDSYKALKGSRNQGDKVIATQYDPMDYDFVWSEDRSVNCAHVQYQSITLCGDAKLRWYITINSDYQNDTWYHMLILRGDGPTNIQLGGWKVTPTNNSSGDSCWVGNDPIFMGWCHKQNHEANKSGLVAPCKLGIHGEDQAQNQDKSPVHGQPQDHNNSQSDKSNASGGDKAPNQISGSNTTINIVGRDNQGGAVGDNNKLENFTFNN